MPIISCQWPDCENTKVVSRGLCARCVKRASRAGIIESFTAPPRTCGHCGREFLTGGKNGKVSYCSTKCQRDGVAKRREESRVKDLTRPCAGCGGSISHTQRNDAQYCSETCQRRAWFEANPDKTKAQAKRWKIDNRDRAKDSDHRRRAALRGSAHEKIDYGSVWERDNGCCWICGEPVDQSLEYPNPGYRSWDHIVPISLGGSHTMGNIALSHLRCNISKRDRILDRKPAWAS